jgi:hypothetical protein
MISEPNLRLAQTMHLSCIQMDRNEISHDPRHVVPSGASKTISEPMVHLQQTVHLSYVKISTIYKGTEMSIQLSLVTRECHRVCAKWFLSHRVEPCTFGINWAPIGCVQNDFWAKAMFSANHAPILYPNGPKWDSTWPTSCRSSIWCVQNDFWAHGTFGANRAPIFHQD